MEFTKRSGEGVVEVVEVVEVVGVEDVEDVEDVVEVVEVVDVEGVVAVVHNCLFVARTAAFTTTTFASLNSTPSALLLFGAR